MLHSDEITRKYDYHEKCCHLNVHLTKSGISLTYLETDSTESRIVGVKGSKQEALFIFQRIKVNAFFGIGMSRLSTLPIVHAPKPHPTRYFCNANVTKASRVNLHGLECIMYRRAFTKVTIRYRLARRSSDNLTSAIVASTIAGTVLYNVHRVYQQ